MRIKAFLFIAALIHQTTGGPVLADDQAPVTLGAVYNMTGAGSTYGGPSSRGAELAIEQINGGGGVLDKKLMMSLKDAGTSDEQTRQAVQELLEESPEAVALFGLSESGLAIVAGKASAEGKRLFLTSGATSPKLPSEVPEYLFLACFGDNVQAAAAADYTYNVLSARSVSVLYDDGHTYTRLLHGYFSEAFSALGGSVASVVAFQGPENLASVTGDINQADVLFLAAETPQGALRMVKELRAKGFDQPIIGGDGYDGEGIWQKDTSVSDVYYTTHAYFGADVKSEPAAEFAKRYAAANQGQRPNGFAGLGYDAVGLLAHAIRTAGSTDPDAVRSALAKTKDYKGVTGTISYVDGSHIPLKSVTLMGIRKGEPTFIKEVLPKSVPKP